MKFKSKPEKANIVMIVILLIIMISIDLVWFYMNEYVYGISMFIIIVLITYIYFFTTYEITKKHFITRLGFIPIKFKLNNIKEVKDLGKKVKIIINNLNLEIYPDNKEKFIEELSKKAKITKK